MTLLVETGAPPDGAETVAVVELAKPTRAQHQPSRGLPTWVVDYALLRLLQGWDHQTTAQHLSAWLPQVFHSWLSTRTVRRWLQDTKKEGRPPRDACDVLIPFILRDKCDRFGEASVPFSARVMQPIFNRVAEQHGMTRSFGIRWTRHFFRCAGFKYRENDGPQAVGHARGQAPIAIHVLRDGVQRPPLLHHQHGRDGREALGPEAPRLSETEARWTGALHRRRGQISTVVAMTGTIMAQLIVEGATKRVVQDLSEHEKISYSFSESHWCTESTCQELIEWLGAWVR